MPDSGLFRRKVMLACFVLLLAAYGYACVLYPNVLIPAGFVPIFAANAYAAYWGLAIRRRLVMRAYRAQALGISSLAIYFFVIGFATSALPTNAQSSGIPVLLNALVDVGFLAIIMYLIHATVAVSKRSDPYERDTLHYSVSKYLWLFAVSIPVAVSLAYDPIGLVFTVAVPLSPLFLALAVAPWITCAGFGGVLLFLSASRSKDKVVQTHVRWFAFYAFAYVLIIAVGGLWRATGGSSGPYGSIIQPFFVGGQVLAAYGLYRCAKSLTPITKVL